jgi:type I restriction-modification system DNA methylase subunit
MTENDQKQLGKTLWNIADQLRGAMNADDFRDHMLSFLFLRYLSDNYEQAAKKELGADHPAAVNGEGKPPLALWYMQNPPMWPISRSGLPANLFYSTGIPVLKKCKKPDDVLFINAAEHFVKGKRQNQLSEDHIARIVQTCQHRKEQDRCSRRVAMSGRRLPTTTSF